MLPGTLLASILRCRRFIKEIGNKVHIMIFSRDLFHHMDIIEIPGRV